ncbi:MAG: septum formation initiator family protein [Lachnospiraceae bacterium]|jgi:cell division protein DivIC|nr:septum formation initiator family protein [Lachnospiraceae bacterium]
MRRKPAMRTNKPRNLLSIATVSVIVVMLVIVLHVGSVRLLEKKAAYDKREAYLLEEIAKEERRTEEIEEYRKYTRTKQYIEDLAKERLGLVYKDEIIFEADN